MCITYLDVASVESGFEPLFSQMSSMEINMEITEIYNDIFVWPQSLWCAHLQYTGPSPPP